MDVLLLLALAGLSFAAYFLSNKASNLKRESDHLSELLITSTRDHEQAVNDHQVAQRDLCILTAKIEGIQSSSLTPENSIPKQIHIEKVIEMSNSISKMQGEILELTRKYEDSRGKQISERVRLGLVGENFAAFHDQFPYDRKLVKALFQPIDLIYFGEDEVVFIDVKTGAASLSTKQKQIRDNIKAHKVRFEVHQIDENGYTIKKAE
jgi:predicted Holliday junction resolvase-like endonuclease